MVHIDTADAVATPPSPEALSSRERRQSTPCRAIGCSPLFGPTRPGAAGHFLVSLGYLVTPLGGSKEMPAQMPRTWDPCAHAECRKILSRAVSSLTPMFKFCFRRLGVEKEEGKPGLTWSVTRQSQDQGTNTMEGQRVGESLDSQETFHRDPLAIPVHPGSYSSGVALMPTSRGNSASANLLLKASRGRSLRGQDFVG